MRSASLAVEYDFDLGVFQIVVEGRFDLSAATDLRQAVRNARADHPLAVIVNMDRVTSVAGVAVLVLRLLRRSGGEAPIMICASPDSECGQVIRGGVYPGLKIYDTEAQALAVLTVGRPARPWLHIHLEANDTAPAAARRLVDKACHEWELQAVLPVAEVIISELVSNAVRHAHSDVEVTITLGKHYLHMQVRDRSQKPPMLPPQSRGRVDDRRGVTLIDKFASSWGTTVTPYGKTVWATAKVPTAGG